MQAAKNAKETAANVAASAQCGVEKTKATVDEKMEMGKARDPAQKEAVTRKKEERLIHADSQEQEARACNAAAKQPGKAGTGGPTGGHPTGTHPTSALPGQGTGGYPIEGVVGSHPIGTNKASAGRPNANDPRVEHDPRDHEGYGT